MANLYWSGKKAKKKELSDHLMEKASVYMEPGTYGVRFDEGDAELWIEVEDPNDDSTTHWHILDNQPKIMGWRVLLFRCPSGYIGAGIKQFFAHEEKSDLDA